MKPNILMVSICGALGKSIYSYFHVFRHLVNLPALRCIIAEMFLKIPLFYTKHARDAEQLDRIRSICGNPTEEDWARFDQIKEGWASMVKRNGPFRRRIEKLLPERYVEPHHHSGLLIVLCLNLVVRRSAPHVPMPPAAVDLIIQLVSYDPAKRPSAVEALAHRFFTEERPPPCKPEE